MNRFFQSLLIVLVLAISLGSISYAGSIQNFIVNLTSQVTGTLPVANGGTGSNSGVAAGTSTPPSNPTVGTLWNCNAISCLHASQNPKERYPVQSLGTQEQTVIPIGTTLVDLFSGGSGVIQYSSIPVTSDPLASATFYGSTAGTTLTVSEPSATASPDMNGPILPGMILKASSGITSSAYILPYGTASTTGIGGTGTYALSANPGTATNITIFGSFWSLPVTAIGNGVAGVDNAVAHGGVYQEGNTLYDYFTELYGVRANVSYSNGSNVLTVNSTTGTELIIPGMNISVQNNAASPLTGIALGTVINAYGSGGTSGTGGTGTYQMSANATNVGTSVSASLGAQAVFVGTASTSAPQTWTKSNVATILPSNFGTCKNNMGNSWLLPLTVGSSYLLSQECVGLITNPIEGSTSEFEVNIATGSTPTGAFTYSIGPLKTILPTANAGAGHLRIYKNAENNCYTGYYHVSPWARVSLPSILYRATTCDPTKDDWTITDGGGTILNLRHPYEYDQTADPSPLFNSSNGNNYLFYTAADNSTGGTGFHAMATPLFPTLYQYDGNEWKIAQSGYDADNALNGTNLGYSYNINAVLTPPSTYTGETVGAWTVSAPTTTGGSTLVSDGAVNDRASWLLPSLPPGNYTATITYDTCSSCGIITVNMDRGVNALTGGTIDTYSASTAYAATSSVTFTTFGVPWRRFIQLNMNTKNASSSNYVGNIRGITITGTSF